jgi:hypothetical protein
MPCIELSPPNIMVKWLPLLLCIWEILGLYHGPETGYANWGFL